jgi:DNA polymerase III epsilon subunit-like protein
MALFLDLETTGLVTRTEVPYPVSISWAVNEEKIQHHLIYPEGWDIPPEVTAIHGISQAEAEEKGRDLGEVLRLLQRDLERVDQIVIHNAKFDQTVLENLIPDIFIGKKVVCTMLSTVQFCRLTFSDRNRRYKWPKLSELYRKLFKKEFEGRLHSSEEDVRCLRDCWRELRERGLI